MENDNYRRATLCAEVMAAPQRVYDHPAAIYGQGFVFEIPIKAEGLRYQSMDTIYLRTKSSFTELRQGDFIRFRTKRAIPLNQHGYLESATVMGEDLEVQNRRVA